jgi:hypothetical protein
MNPFMDKVNLKIRVAPVQRRALKKEAQKRGITASQLLREQIAAVTGVADPLSKGRKPPRPPERA